MKKDSTRVLKLPFDEELAPGHCYQRRSRVDHSLALGLVPKKDTQRVLIRPFDAESKKEPKPTPKPKRKRIN
jgi:hypothetical protein